MNEFDKKKVIVTGAGSGMGLAIARRLLEEGAKVTALDINVDGLSELKSAFDENLSVYSVDIREIDSLLDIVQREEKLGAIDHLVNAAGTLTADPLLEIAPEQWKRVLDINLNGTFFLTQFVVQKMVQRNAGSVVTISSNAGKTPRMNMGSYPVSKAALTFAMKCLALECAPFGVRINTVSPGSTDTPMQRAFQKDGNGSEQILKGNGEQFRTGIPLNKIGSVNDITEAVLFLLSSKSGQITMENLTVDGGATLG